MPRYRMKDKRLREALEASYPWFADQFENAVGQGENVTSIIITRPDNSSDWMLALPTSELEAYEVYDPKKWNPWPGTEPPGDVPMRVLTDCGQHRCLFFSDVVHQWVDMDTGEEAGFVGKYRPWFES